MLHCVYKHTFPNGKVYIGQTTQGGTRQRWQNGFGYKGQSRLFSEIVRMGWDNIKHEILEDEIVTEDIDAREAYYIGYFNATDPEYGYNCDPRRTVQNRKRAAKTLFSLEEMWLVALWLKYKGIEPPVDIEILKKIRGLDLRGKRDDAVRLLNELLPIFCKEY